MAVDDQAARLRKLIDRGDQVVASHRPNPPNIIGFTTIDTAAFAAWRTQALTYLSGLIGEGHHYYLSFAEATKAAHLGNSKEGVAILRTLLEDMEAGHLAESREVDPVVNIERICDRFHRLAIQLRHRHDGRDTLRIDDEYDVQDLMHALLRLYFEDVREEESTPSYAGKSSRMDFLLKTERTVVEVKMVRPGLDAKALGTELIEDKERYSTHPDCGVLICFVYDPTERLRNPGGLESDLSRHDGPFRGRVFIRPRR